jgi:Flp pilus assembly protein TadG
MKRGFFSDRRGNIAILFALIAPMALAAVGVALDFQRLQAARDQLQDAADNVALRAARELLLENATASSVEALMRATADAQYGKSLNLSSIDPVVDKDQRTATLTLTTSDFKGLILTHIKKDTLPIVATATAMAQGVSNVCVIALGDGGSAISADMSAALAAKSCAILSNSTATDGISVKKFAKIDAAFICSAGGSEGGSSNFNPSPLHDCPAYDDPLAKRTPPTVGACDYYDASFDRDLLDPQPSDPGKPAGKLDAELVSGAYEGTLPDYFRVDLLPGVYCGGVRLAGRIDAHLAPGVYIIKDGPLRADGGARIFGEGVGFYFDGDLSTFEFRDNSVVHLTAPTSGLMAGLLMWESADAPVGRAHRILSFNARQLLGTLYLPRGVLEVDTKSPVADSSAYTAIVSRSLSLSGSPTLNLNTDYAATDVPVPEGVGATGGQVYLRN